MSLSGLGVFVHVYENVPNLVGSYVWQKNANLGKNRCSNDEFDCLFRV